jgi:asparagine synthase (glutamine-hydrolysing)
VRNREYWDLVFPEDGASVESSSVEAYRERLSTLLEESVGLRLQADVPVGFYLSGGIDSSLIAALIHRLSPGVARDSFSIAFHDAEIDERRFQRLMAERVGSRHHEIDFGWSDIETRLKRVILHDECPLKETYNTCSMALSGLVRENGLKVILTGEGADELFAGYVGYRFDLEERGASRPADDPAALLERDLRADLWDDPDLFYERDYYAFREIKQALYAPDLAESLDAFDATRERFIDTSKLTGRHPLHKRSYLDFKFRLADHLVGDHGDRVGYANSVEARYPFLDPRLFDFARTIPVNHLIREGEEKSILRDVARPLLPPEIVNRRKFGFVAPGSPYLLRRKIDWIDDLLSYETVKRQGYFNPDTVERLKSMYRADNFRINQTFETDLLMIVLSFGIFLETFSMPNRGC